MKYMFFILITACIMLLSACGGEGDDDGLRIAIVTSLTGIDDMSFNQNNYEGIRQFVDANPGNTVTHIHEPTGGPGAAIQSVANIAGDFDVVVLPGFQFSNIGAIAVAHPDTYFILIDTWPAAYGGTNVFANVRAIEFAEQESGFLAGIIAALETNTGRVAFVGGAAFPALVNYQFGFESGVNYANTVLGTRVEVVNLPLHGGTDVLGNYVGGNYVGGFDHPAQGRQIANELLAAGVDIIFVAAGNSGYGVHRAVEAYSGNARIIGVDTDNFGIANVEITSVYKATGLNVMRSLLSIHEGNFVGGNHTMRVDSNSVGVILASGRHQLAAATLNRVNELFSSLRDGIIVPASNFNGFAPDNFPGLP